MKQVLRFCALIALLSCVSSVCSAATVLGPSPYLQFSDSPFSGGLFSYFHLENFEDGALNVPGVTASDGGVIPPGFLGSIDSVDGDDGAVDGSGLLGHSWFSGDGSVNFTFNAGILGKLPTNVGIVLTDAGSNPITFQAFDAGGTKIAESIASFVDGSYGGGTAEDRFFGVVSAGGIGSISISSPPGIEVDHLQYGVAIPLPTSAWSGLALLGGLGVLRLRRRNA